MICRLCPRSCGAMRTETLSGGVCAAPARPVVARAMLHQWEEPCLTGERGPGRCSFRAAIFAAAFARTARSPGGVWENR